MSRKAFVLAFILAFRFGVSDSQSPPSDQPGEEAVLSFVAGHQPLIDSVLNGRFGLDSRLAISIALPEAACYSRFRDAMETSALQVFYIELGEEYANFSIGKLQMKPSFCDELEQQPAARPYAEYFHYASTNEYKIREERVDRLCALHWQLAYLGLFIRVMEKQFGERLNEQNLPLFAGAYNLGINVSREKVMTWNLVSNFPSGKRKSTDQPYAHLATKYFQLLQKPTDSNETPRN